MSKNRGKSKLSKTVLFNANKHVFHCEKSLGTFFYGQPSYLEFQMMEKIQKPNNYECSTSLSEPLRFCLFYFVRFSFFVCDIAVSRLVISVVFCEYEISAACHTCHSALTGVITDGSLWYRNYWYSCMNNKTVSFIRMKYKLVKLTYFKTLKMYLFQHRLPQHYSI
jgi:hypothetical protein